MKFLVRDMDIATGGPLISIINFKDAEELDLHSGDRVRLNCGRKKAIAIVDFAESKKALPRGKIGLFEELIKKLNVKNNDKISLKLVEKPKSIRYIRKTLDGEKLNPKEIRIIIEDIVNNRLSEAELAYFVAASYTHIMSINETVALTKAMINTGDVLKLKCRNVIDKHCIGGVAGNRTTMIIMPIIAAAGLIIPKTSSRSITSPAGTADTMEVLTNVSHSLEDIKKIIKKTNGCLVWGGSLNLAPADDKIIKVEHPLNLDARSQLLASILAKKASVSAKHVLVDIPVGKGAKIHSKKRALILKKQFELIGKKLGMQIYVVITNGSEPVGKGLGPVLEARDVLYVLKGDKRMPVDLKKKSIRLAGIMLEMGKKAKKGEGVKLAREILESGKAYDKFIEIIKAQGGKEISPDKLKLAKFKRNIKAEKRGKVMHIDNATIAKVARIAGAPADKEAGIYLYVRKNMQVKKGEVLFTIYSNSKAKLKFAVNTFKEIGGVVIKS
ncbi:AMP phosphorylase [Candidatus Woesearchaeota archaeon]|nr:AMP phosphorylase [Candidatus Woesearchaeota archaeon]